MVMGKMLPDEGRDVGVRIYDGKKARICADILLALFEMDFAAVCLLEFRA